LTGPAKRRALASCACLVLPSYVEASPVSVLEAMAWAKPVVATRVGGVPEIVAHGVEGFLVEPGDPRGLADALMKLCDDESLRGQMGRAARERVRDAYSADVMGEAILEVYDDVRRGRP